MNKESLDVVVEKTRELINAPTCCSEAKLPRRLGWMRSGLKKESAEAKKYVAELEADIMPIDNLIGFASSDAGMQYFGADTAKGIVTHANEIKAAGAKYCDCPACAAVEAILEKKELLLK